MTHQDTTTNELEEIRLLLRHKTEEQKRLAVLEYINQHYISKQEVSKAIDGAEIEYMKYEKCPVCTAPFMYQCTCDQASNVTANKVRKALNLERDNT